MLLSPASPAQPVAHVSLAYVTAHEFFQHKFRGSVFETRFENVFAVVNLVVTLVSYLYIMTHRVCRVHESSVQDMAS